MKACQVPYTTCRMVKEQHVRYETRRHCYTVCETHAARSPTQTCRMVKEEHVRYETRCVTEQVPAAVRAASAGDDLPDGLRAEAMCRPTVPRQHTSARSGCRGPGDHLQGDPGNALPHGAAHDLLDGAVHGELLREALRAGVRTDLPDVPVIRPEAGVRRQESGVGESRLLIRLCLQSPAFSLQPLVGRVICRRWAGACSALEMEGAVARDIAELFAQAVRPLHLDMADAVGGPEPEVEDRRPAGQVTLGGAEDPKEPAAARHDGDLRPVRVAAQLGIGDAHLEPLAAVRSNIAVQSARPLMVVTNRSSAPSLSKSPQTSPRPTFRCPQKGPLRRETSTNRPDPVLASNWFRSAYGAQKSGRPSTGSGCPRVTRPLTTARSRKPSLSKSAKTVPKPVPRRRGLR